MGEHLRYAIWWLDQPSCEVVAGTRFHETLPAYIAVAFESRMGRAGRGRLWGMCAEMVDTAEMASWGSGDWGGIVIAHRDRAKLAYAPGFLTDMSGHFVAALTNAPLRDYPERTS